MPKKSLSINVDLERCHFEHFNPVAPPNRILRDRFTSSGLSLSELASHIGYRNINKGVRRIQSWLDSCDVPKTSEGTTLLEALNITRESLATELVTYHRDVARLQIYGGNRFEQSLLKDHVERLMTNASTILNTRQWFHIDLPYVGIFGMYVSLPSIELGQLLRAWTNKGMQLDDFMAVHVVGSPLSGSHRATGFYRSDPTEWVSKPQIFPHLGNAVKTLHPFAKAGTLWSLGQLVVDLGGELDATKIFQAHDEIGTYDYITRTLTLHGIDTDLSDYFNNPNKRLSQSNNHLSQVTMYKQNLQVNKRILCHWNQDLPPIVAQQVAEQLW